MTIAFRERIDRLADVSGRARIQVRIDRLAHGNPGTHRGLRGGVKEMKIDVGPGYRVYYCERGSTLVLLARGDKSTEGNDIRIAIELARNL
jgi:putative addiction module killer protein